jgi:hypothetical protein
MSSFLLLTSKKEMCVSTDASSNILTGVVEEDLSKGLPALHMVVRKVAGIKVHENVAPSAVFHDQKKECESSMWKRGLFGASYGYKLLLALSYGFSASDFQE